MDKEALSEKEKMKISFMSKLIDDLSLEIRCAHTTKAEETPLLLCEHSFSVPISVM